jgi:lipopolysaccharide export system permease protein
MQYLTRYIFRQLFFAVLITTLVLTSIMWLAQSLKYIDFIANKGAPFLLFGEMILYLLPNLFVITVPIAILIGVIFIYNKLITDHELTVMQAVGVGHWQLAKPAILLSLMCTLFLYMFTLYVLPLSFRHYRDISLTLREKSLSTLVQIGQFSSLGKYTVYARSQDSAGNFLGVLIYDGSEGKNKMTFMAEKGIVLHDTDGGRLLLINGNRQEQDLKTGKPSILYFNQYLVEAKNKAEDKKKEGRFLRTYERFVEDLLNPSEDLSPSVRLEFISAAHQRLISPLYALVFGLLAACSLILGSYNKRGRVLNMVVACVLATLVEVLSIIFLHTLKQSGAMIYLSYGLVFSSILICLILLTPWANSSLKRPLQGRRS